MRVSRANNGHPHTVDLYSGLVVVELFTGARTLSAAPLNHSKPLRGE